MATTNSNVDRRSSSSSCLLEPKYSFCNEDDNPTGDQTLEQRASTSMSTAHENNKPTPLSVTVIHHEKLPTYSTERFYMLSEIEQKARAIIFLSDFTDDNTATTTSSEDSLAGCAASNPFPSHMILYILWRPDNTASVSDFVDGYIEEPVKQLLALAKREDDDAVVPQIYVVVDTLVPEDSATGSVVTATEEGEDRAVLQQLEEDAWPDDWADASSEFQLAQNETTDGGEKDVPKVDGTHAEVASSAESNTPEESEGDKVDRKPTPPLNMQTGKDGPDEKWREDWPVSEDDEVVGASGAGDTIPTDEVLDDDRTDRTDVEESDDSAEEQSRKTDNGKSTEEVNEALEGDDHDDGYCDPAIEPRQAALVASHSDSMCRLPIYSNSPAARAGEPQFQIANDSPESLPSRHEAQMEIAEELAKKVSQSGSLRTSIEGITVGVVDHVRAAPGLEACLDAVTLGANARRRAQSPKGERDRKALIGIVCQTTEDMVGLGDGETDAVQGVFQSRLSAEWSGKGNLESFAKRAQEEWCRQHGVPSEEPVSPRRRRLSNLYNQPHPAGGNPTSQLFAILFIGFIAYLWMYVTNIDEQQ